MSGTLAVDRHPTAVIRNCRGEAFAGRRLDVPAVRRFVVARRGDARAEPDVAPEVETVGDMVEVAQDLRLLRVALRPTPVPQQLLGEVVRIGVALGIAPRAGIAVPVPGAAHALARLQELDGEAEPVAQAEELVQAGEPGADDQGVVLAGLRVRSRRRCRCAVVHGARRLQRSVRGGGNAARSRAMRPSLRLRRNSLESAVELGEAGGMTPRPPHHLPAPRVGGPARRVDDRCRRGLSPRARRRHRPGLGGLPGPARHRHGPRRRAGSLGPHAGAAPGARDRAGPAVRQPGAGGGCAGARLGPGAARARPLL